MSNVVPKIAISLSPFLPFVSLGNDRLEERVREAYLHAGRQSAKQTDREVASRKARQR